MVIAGFEDGGGPRPRSVGLSKLEKARKYVLLGQ